MFRWLNLPDPAPDIARDRQTILETYRDVTARAWDQSYQAVYRYHRRHGTLSIPADLTSPSGVNLAGWLHSQREAYRSNELTALQIQKLEALGMQWAPFEARGQRMISWQRPMPSATGTCGFPMIMSQRSMCVWGPGWPISVSCTASRR